MTCADLKHCAESTPPSELTEFRSSVTGQVYKVQSGNVMTCKSTNIIYLQTCIKCGMQYVGETEKTLKDRMNNHRADMKAEKASCRCQHFSHNGHTQCSPSDVRVMPIEQIPDFTEISNRNERNKRRRE